jgi:uncharacterized protein YkwD
MTTFLADAFIPHARNDYKPHALRAHMLSTYAALILFVKATVVVALSLLFPDPSAFAAITAERIVELANVARAQQGLTTLVSNDMLDQAAAQKVEHMFQYGYFDHFEPDGTAPWHWLRQEGYIYTVAGENLGMNFTDADAIHKAWMNSASHRANVLNPNFRDIGIAVSSGKLNGKETILVVEYFGRTVLPSPEPEFAQPVSPGVTTVSGVSESTGEPQIISKEVEVQIDEPAGWIAEMLQGSQLFFLAFFVFLTLALAIKILVNIQVQHGHIIFYTTALIALLVLMILVKFHWMEYIVPTNTIL